MNPNPEILKVLSVFCTIHSKPITESLIQVWDLILSELTPEELALAAKDYATGSQCEFFPNPGQLYRLARPEVNTEGEATLIAERLWSACSYGTDPIGETRAKTFINSEFGWAVVQNNGGWYTFNTSVTDMEQGPILKSQWRKAIVEMMGKKKRGESLVPRLDPDSIRLKQSAQDILKTLGITMKTIEREE